MLNFIYGLQSVCIYFKKSNYRKIKEGDFVVDPNIPPDSTLKKTVSGFVPPVILEFEIAKIRKRKYFGMLHHCSALSHKIDGFPVDLHSFVLKNNIHIITCSIHVWFNHVNIVLYCINCIVLIQAEILMYGNYIIQDEIKMDEEGMDRVHNGRIIVKSPIIYTLKKSID